MTELDWQEHAACRGADINEFFPHSHANISDATKQRCADCPVRIQCAEWAIADPSLAYGYIGGLTVKERRAERARRATRQQVQCGTRSGYVTHRSRGEEACDECKAASAEYSRERRRTRREGVVA